MQRQRREEFATHLPASMLYLAAHFLSTPKARMTWSGILDSGPPIGKLPIERCVCAPHSRELSTSSGPKASVSVRVVESERASSARWRPAPSSSVCLSTRLVE